MTSADHCTACAIARELTDHRNRTAARWSQRRAAFSFAVIVAQRTCPDYTPKESQ